MAHPQQTQHQRPAGPPNTQQQPLIQSQQQSQPQPQIHPTQHQHAQATGYAPHPGMQYPSYPPHYTVRPQQFAPQYTPAMAPSTTTYMAYPYNPHYPHQQQWQAPATQFTQASVVAPSSHELSGTTPHVSSITRTPRPRQKAVITDPKTGKPIDLGEESKPDSSKSSSSVKPTTTTTTTTPSLTTKTTSTQPSATITPANITKPASSISTPMTAADALKKNNPNITANANNITTPTTNLVTTSLSDKTNVPSQPIHALLRKVSEDTSSDKRQAGVTPASRTNAATITTPTKTATKASVTPATIKPATTKALPIVPPPPQPAAVATAPPAAVTLPSAASVPAAPSSSLAKSVKVAQGQENVVEKKTSSPAPAQVVEKPAVVDANIDNINGKGEDKTRNDIDPKKGGDSKEVKETLNETAAVIADGANDESKDSTVNDNNVDNKKEEREVIELHYETGQYNPMSNRLGKKKYSKEFLIEVCEKICKLSVLLVDDEKEDNSMDNYSLNNQVDIFKPKFSKVNYPQANRQNDPSRRPNQQNYMGRSSAGQERQRKVIASSSLTNEVELKTVANPWRPTKDVKEDIPVDVVELEDLKKKFRSILNKLTPNNFETLSQAVTNLNIDTEGKLGEVIDIVFAKALAEPGYCTLYGRMCSHLKKTSAGTANFGNTLLKRCQNQFQSDIYSGVNVDERKQKIEDEENAETKKQLNEELYEEMFRCRMRGLGLIKFIGELYKIEMLNDMIMFECILRLLMDTSEESLECLCDLLVTIGEKLDRSNLSSAKEDKKAQRGSAKGNAYQSGKTAASVVAASNSAQQKSAPEAISTLDDIFDQLHKIRKNQDLPISLRIRFKLLDVCELRENDKWQSKKDDNLKKIEEIREAHMETKDAERRKDMAMGPRRSQDGRRGGLGQSSGSSSHISSLANGSGVYRGGANMHTSASSHSIRDHSLEDDMQNNQYSQHKQNLQSTKLLSNFLNKGPSSLSNQTDQTSLRPASSFKLGIGSGGTTSLRPTFGRKGASPATGGATTPTTTGSAAAGAPTASSGLGAGSASSTSTTKTTAVASNDAPPASNATASDKTTSRTTNSTTAAAAAASSPTPTTNCK